MGRVIEFGPGQLARLKVGETVCDRRDPARQGVFNGWVPDPFSGDKRAMLIVPGPQRKRYYIHREHLCRYAEGGDSAEVEQSARRAG